MKEIVNLTPELFSSIGTVYAGAPTGYREQKFAASMQAREVDQAGATPHDAGILSIAGPDSLPRLHETQREAIDKLVLCALIYVDKGYPLLEGESVTGHFASYLTQPYLEYPAGTAVIKRTTNMADLYYVIGNVTVTDRGDLVRVEPKGPRPLLRGGKITAQSLATAAAKKLLGSIVGAIGGAIAGKLFKEFFPPGVPSYFDEVYEQMSKIVSQRLEENTIATINGAINSVKDHIANEYRPKRMQADLNNQKDRKALFALLQKYDTTFLSGPGGMLGTLQDAKYAQGGFAAFLLGANLQLALFQEMANVEPRQDPKTQKWPGPLETSYGKPRTGTVALTAKGFADYAEATWPKLIKAREDVIKYVTYEEKKYQYSTETGLDVSWEVHGAIEDGETRTQARQLAKRPDKNGSYPSLDQLKRDKDAYVEQAKWDLHESYSNPPEIIRTWRQIVDKPIIPLPDVQ